jgi:hypothetical protein
MTEPHSLLEPTHLKSSTLAESSLEPLEPKAQTALNIIRTATALTRYPIHRLAKRGTASIEVRRKDEGGTYTLRWDVSHNSKYGQPGPLAYKLDTLVINRKIEEAGYPTPSILRLGSLREICRELGLSEGENTDHIKNALYQNAGTFITAKLRYKAKDKSAQNFEFGAARYGVVFTGEELPDGRKADAVYVVFHLLYRDLLNKAETRPLDYNYLKSLKSPVAQRFYELLSFQIYGALESKRPRRAKYLYSEFCQEAPQTRYLQFKRMHRQMKEIHAPHIKGGYIMEPVEFVPTTDAEGQPDWEMLYTPGPRARAEHKAANQKAVDQKADQTAGQQTAASQKTGGQGTAKNRAIEQSVAGQTATNSQEATSSMNGGDQLLLPAPKSLPSPSKPTQTDEEARTLDAETQTPVEEQTPVGELIEQLVRNELNRGAAILYAKANPEECRRQLEYLPYVTEFKSSKGAYLRSAIEEGYGPPKGYAKAKNQEEAQKRKEEEAARAKARQSHEEAHRRENILSLCQWAGQMKEEHHEAFTAFESYVERKRAERARSKVFPKDPALQEIVLAEFSTEKKRLELFIEFFRQNPCPLPELKAWLQKHRDTETQKMLSDVE